jgi:hypothetical protein
MAAQLFNVHDAMVACGIDNVLPYNGLTKAQRIATDVFNDDFQTCMDKTHTDLDGDLKSYVALAANAGRITLGPGPKRNLKAFIQWTRDQIRTDNDPTALPFPVAEAASLIRRYKTHETFVTKSKTLADTAKPKPLDEKMKWEDWNPVFINFLRSIPGLTGIPLAYVCRDPNPVGPGNHNDDFLDDYIQHAPLQGEAFTRDAAEVHTYIVSFIAGNTTAESKVMSHAEERNGRLDYLSLKEHYEGVGVNAVDALGADKALENLFYSGEKKPHMWWEEFERQLTRAFNVYDRRANRQVFPEEMKLRMLCRKVTADFLQHTRSAINLELTRVPMTMTYNQALSAFRNEVNRKFPPGMSTNQRARRVNQVGQRGRGRGNGNGRQKRSHRDSRQITLTDGKRIDAHASYNFPRHIWAKIPQNEKDRLTEERRQYKRSRNQGQNQNSQQASLTQSQVSDMSLSNAGSNDASNGGNSIMGGRREQASLRSRNSE